MKKLLLTATILISISAIAQEPIRCKKMTRWGQCTNEAITTDSVCVLHKDTQSQPTTVTQTTRATTTNSRATFASTPRTTTSSRQTSTRCIAITRSGSQCKRNAKSGSSYCYQHSR